MWNAGQQFVGLDETMEETEFKGALCMCACVAAEWCSGWEVTLMWILHCFPLWTWLTAVVRHFFMRSASLCIASFCQTCKPSCIMCLCFFCTILIRDTILKYYYCVRLQNPNMSVFVCVLLTLLRTRSWWWCMCVCVCVQAGVAFYIRPCIWPNFFPHCLERLMGIVTSRHESCHVKKTHAAFRLRIPPLWWKPTGLFWGVWSRIINITHHKDGPLW